MPVDTSGLTVLGNKVLEPRREVECFPNPHSDLYLTVTCSMDEFTCLCPVTGQPDFAKVVINYCPKDLIVESKSLKLYLWSFRDERGFHEDLTGQIARYLFVKLQPDWLSVEMIFNPRGGISITAKVNLPSV